MVLSGELERGDRDDRFRDWAKHNGRDGNGWGGMRLEDKGSRIDGAESLGQDCKSSLAPGKIEGEGDKWATRKNGN